MKQTTFPEWFEIVDGEVVELSPTGAEHGEVEGNAYTILRNAARTHGPGKVFVGEVGIVVRQDPLTVRGADAAFAHRDQLPLRLSPEGYLLTAPAIVVEVLSPNDRASELQKKVQEYHAAGVRVVMLVDPQNRCVTVARPEALQLVKEAEHLELAELLPGWSVPVAEFFADL